ncbi:hypothetical protein HPB49_016551 [Dermacentor silvarum]|uniref:Uncharacterized protein n=1 Tax=Dermacentor silvarum TaxID=543639 RepID=A0ACB8DEN0_DERSI|nr:hypothetical protein HPB49_016551 [Dermacentor silvarum]
MFTLMSDQTLQDIVYKLVPGLFRNEMRRRREFYASLPPSERSSRPISSEGRGDVRNVERLIFNREDLISVSLEYSARDILPIRPLLLGPPLPESQESPPGSRRYLLCPGGFTVGHLKKFLRAKFGLSKNHEVDVMYMHDHLLDEYALMDLAYIYSWRRNAPMRLLYRFPVLPPSLVSSSSKADDAVPVPPDEGKSIFIGSTASHQTTDVPPAGSASSKRSQAPSSDASANANAVCATNPSHVNPTSVNRSDTGSKVPSSGASANQPASWLGRTPSSSPPVSRVVTSGQRPGSKATVFSKTTPPSHRKNGVSTANGVHSNLRLILPAPAKANGLTDSREVLPKATKASSRPSDSPSSPAKRPHLDSRPGKEAAVS